MFACLGRTLTTGRLSVAGVWRASWENRVAAAVLGSADDGNDGGDVVSSAGLQFTEESERKSFSFV